MLRPRRRPPLVLYVAVGLGLGLLAAALLSRPRVTGHRPASGASDVAAQAAIRITFSQPMRTESVESRFHTSPPRPGTFRWEGRTMIFEPSQPWPQATRVEVELEGGALSLRGLPTFGATRWSFTTGAGRLAYLWPAGQAADLYLWSLPPVDAEPAPAATTVTTTTVATPVGPAGQRLTHTAEGILDFSLTPDAGGLVFTARAAGGTEIRLLNLNDESQTTLYQCPAESVCRDASLSPDMTMLAYVEEDPRPDGATVRRVWAKALDGGQPYAVAGEDHPSSQPKWSSLNWLVVYDQSLMAYALYDKVTRDGARLAFVIPNAVGETPAWSPDGQHLVFPEIVFPAETPSAGAGGEGPPRFYSHLQRVAINDGAQVDLSGEASLWVEDTGPAYSPVGGWLAFARRSLDPSLWTLGRQIWRMRPDGVDPTQLTAEPELNHGGLTWSPDGTRLAYVLFDQINPDQPPEVWWRWADGRDGGRVVVGGYSPLWIP